MKTAVIYTSQTGFTKRYGVRLFYFPAGFNYEKMSAPSRFMMKVFNKMLASKAASRRTPITL